MSCFTKMSAVTATGDLDLTKHVNYTAGMILGVDDFTQEFAYLAGRDRWLARDALGYGTVSGLSVRIEEDAEKGQRVTVTPGVAISPRGQLICVSSTQCAYLNQWLAAANAEDLSDRIAGSPPIISPPDGDASLTLYVVLCYRDCLTDNVPIPGEPCRNSDELMADSRVKDDFSLELRFDPPKQLEEEAVRNYCDFLRQITISDDSPSTPIEDFLDAIRNEFLSSGSPSGSPSLSSPPVVLHIHPEDVAEYIRLAFRLWVTELRNVLSEKETGCAVEMTGGKKLEDCVLLAELRVPLEFVSPGWKVSDTENVEVNEENRPFLLHLRMLQEWMLNEPNDHGALTGLEDDDHPQYLLINGTRAMTGNLNLGGKKITNLAAGTANNHAVNFQQAIKVGDAAGGDLTAMYPNPTIANLQGKPVVASAPANGHILIYRTNKWVTEKPVTDHGELTGLTDDDHPQYLLISGSRAMTGNLSLGGKKITSVAAGTANGEAVIFEQAIKQNDAAGGDLTATYPNPTVSKLQGKPLAAPAPAEGQILIFKTGKWIAETPAPSGVTDHAALTGLANDDHKQYLPLTGSRQMTGILKLGNNRITGIADGTAAGDAVTFSQAIKSGDAAGGDLTGTYPNPIINSLQGKPIKANAPNVNDALIWNGSEWVPKPVQGGSLLTLPLATITRMDNNTFEVWFNIDAPGNLALIDKLPSPATQKAIIVEGENGISPEFIESIPASISISNFRNVFILSLQKTEMTYMRFSFSLTEIKVKVPGTANSITLSEYAKQNSIEFQGSSKADDTATIFVRLPRGTAQGIK